MKRGAKIAASFTIFAVATLALWVLLFEPFKVTDPDDPRFDPMRFKFSDYRPEEWHLVLRKVFHPGDPRSRVEDILVKRAGAWPGKYRTTFLRYSWHPWYNNINMYGVLAVYDQQDRLLAMKTTRGDVFNKEQVDSAILQASIESSRSGEEYKRKLREQGQKP